jgi:predicted esterase
MPRRPLLGIGLLIGLLACRGAVDGSPRVPTAEEVSPPVVAANASRGSEADHDVPASSPNPADLAPGAVTSAPALASSSSWPRTPPVPVKTDWCIDKVSTLDEGACYVLPDAPTATLLIYLHGIVPPTAESQQKTHVQTVVANAVRRAGVVALIPRGKQGLAPRGREGWWGWPTSEPSYAQYAATFIASFAEERRKLEAVTGVTFSRVYIAGSSSGAYFATRLALHGDIAADGFGAMSGGIGWESSELETLPPRPFYIGYGRYDKGVRGSARALGDILRRAGWPVRVAEHPVDHGAQEVYLDEAFSFWAEHP